MVMVVVTGVEGSSGRKVHGATSSLDSVAGVSEFGAGSDGGGGFSGEVAAATASSTGGGADICFFIGQLQVEEERRRYNSDGMTIMPSFK